MNAALERLKQLRAQQAKESREAVVHQENTPLRPLPRESSFSPRPETNQGDGLPSLARGGQKEAPHCLEVQESLLHRPYINDRGELIIPFESDRRYRWWAGGQSIAAILRELHASREVWERYTDVPYDSVQ